MNALAHALHFESVISEARFLMTATILPRCQLTVTFLPVEVSRLSELEDANCDACLLYAIESPWHSIRRAHSIEQYFLFFIREGGPVHPVPLVQMFRENLLELKRVSRWRVPINALN